MKLAIVVVDASSMVDSAKLGALVTGIAKVDAINNLSLDLGVAADDLIVPLLDKAGTGSRASTTGASTAEIAKVVDKITSFAAGGLSGVMTLSAAQMAAATGAVLGPKLASVFALTVLGGAHASFLPSLTVTSAVATFADIFAQLNAAGGFGIPQTASTSAVAQVTYIYFSDSGSSLKGGYLVINNQDAVFDRNDTIISLSGALLVGNLSEISIVYKDMFVFG